MTDSIRAAEELNPLVPHLSEIILGAAWFLILLVRIWKFVVPNFEKAYAERTAAMRAEALEIDAWFRALGL